MRFQQAFGSVFLAIGLLVATGCGGDAEQSASAVPAPTEAPTTPAVAPTPDPTPTTAPPPATAVPEPTTLPTPTPTPIPVVACVRLADSPEEGREQTMAIFGASGPDALICLLDTANVDQLECGPPPDNVRFPGDHQLAACEPDDRFVVSGRLVPEEDPVAVAKHELNQSFAAMLKWFDENLAPAERPTWRETGRAYSLDTVINADGQAAVFAHILYPQAGPLGVAIIDDHGTDEARVTVGIIGGYPEDAGRERLIQVIDDGVMSEASHDDIERVKQFTLDWLRAVDDAHPDPVNVTTSFPHDLPAWFTLLPVPADSMAALERAVGAPPARSPASPAVPAAPASPNPAATPSPPTEQARLTDAEVAARCAASAPPPSSDDPGSLSLSIRILTVNGIEYLCPRNP